jgi:periplasmic protein TonB
VFGWQHCKTREYPHRLHRSDQPDEADAGRSEQQLGNVVLFPRSRPDDPVRSAPTIAREQRAARTIPALRGRAIYGGLLIVSLAAHAALLAFLNREPTPTASVGEEVISVEIIVGATTQAGDAQRPSETEIDNSSAKETDAEKPPAETAPEEKQEEKQKEEPADREPVRTAEEPQAVEEAMPSTLSVAPEQRPQEPIREEASREPAPQPKRDAAPPKPKTSSAPSVASRGVGRGRSESDANYNARVAAHLARFKRFPPEARARGHHGSALVSFQLDGDGRVSSVRVVRASGVAALDEGVVAMVRRASPFPPPPNGRPKSFTAPVSFKLN